MSTWDLGIDFGTSYTVVAVAQDGNVATVDVESNGRVAPSLFCLLVARRDDPRRDRGATSGRVRSREVRTNSEAGPRRGRALLGRPGHPCERARRRGPPARLHRSLQATGRDDSPCCAHHASGGLERGSQVHLERSGREGRHAHLRARDRASRRSSPHKPLEHTTRTDDRGLRLRRRDLRRGGAAAGPQMASRSPDRLPVAIPSVART